MFPYFRGYLLCVEAYRIYSVIMSHFLYQKIGSKLDCVVYAGLYNFMRQIPVCIFALKKSRFTLSYDVL